MNSRNYAVAAVHVCIATGALGALDVAVQEPFDVMQAYAAAGDPSAQFNLALAYQKGEGTAKDAARAVEWYRKAAAAALPEAQFNLGVLFANGVEVPRDDKEAAKWIYAAAQNGVFDAQQILIGFHAQGRGVEKSAAKALAWDAYARRTLQLRHGVPAGAPPHPGNVRADGAAEFVGKEGKKEWVHDDGGRETAGEDGARVIVYKDGRKVVVSKSGTRDTEYPNGTTERVLASGRKTLTDPKGIVQVTEPDGTRTEEGPGTDSKGRSVRIQDTFDKDGKRTRRRVVVGNETHEERPGGGEIVELKTKDDRGIEVIVSEEYQADGTLVGAKIKRADNGEGPKDKEVWTIRRTLDLKGGATVEIMEKFMDIGCFAQEEVPGTRRVEPKTMTAGSSQVRTMPNSPMEFRAPVSVPMQMPVKLPDSVIGGGGGIAKGYEDPTAFRAKADIAPMLASLEQSEMKARNFAGATDADYQRAKAGADLYFIPLPAAPQKTAAAPAWLREKTLSPTTLHETTLTPILDDRSKQFPLGFHSRVAITLHPWKHAETEHFVVHYLDEAEAKQTMQYIEGAYTMSTALLNLDPKRAPGRSHVFIFDDRTWPAFLSKIHIEQQSSGAGARTVLAGFAYKTELFFGASTDKERREQSAKTLCHEVTHAIVSRFYPGRKLPLWMNEGFADYVAARTLATKRGQAISTYLSHNGDGNMDVEKVFDRIKYGERSAPDRIVAFYGNSERCVRTVAEKLPLEAFPKFFNALAAGNEPSAAFSCAYGKQCDGVAAFKKVAGAGP